MHGHTDYITDLDVSKCNKYLASAGKDGKIIIYDIETCNISEIINNHTSSVNNIKFLRFKIKKENQNKLGNEYI